MASTDAGVLTRVTVIGEFRVLSRHGVIFASTLLVKIQWQIQ